MDGSSEKDLAHIKNGLQDIPVSEFPSTPSLSDASAGNESYEPSVEELVHLRRIGSKIPAAAWLVASFSGAERFAFFALQEPLRRNTMSFNHYPL